MKFEIAQLLVETADDIGVEMTLTKDYSGRSMYGKTTAGVDYNEDRHLLCVVAAVARNLGASEEADGCPNGVSADEFVESMRNVKFDNMGRGLICY